MPFEVRPPQFGEVTEVVKKCREMHATSSWSWVPFSPQRLRTNILRLIDRHDACVLVSWDDGKPVGILIGMLDSFIYGNSYYATDIEFIAEKGGDELLSKFTEWAFLSNAVAVVMGMSNKSDHSEEAKDRYFKSRGFEKTGGMYLLEKGK